MSRAAQQRNPTYRLADVLATDDLRRRKTRQPDHIAEIAALHALAQRLADDPDTMLDSLMDIAMRLCDAGTAGLSVLEQTASGEPVFRWAALRGALAAHAGGSTPRAFSPCGVCLDRDAPQLFSYPERYFTYFQAASPVIVEGLVIPVKWNGEALGTIWIASHDEARVFDGEDARVMESLASFTAAALCVWGLRRDAHQITQQLEHRVEVRTAELTESHARLTRALAECTALEAARSEWLRTLMNAQEDERRRVARELHDEMSQHLTGLTLSLHALGQADEEERDRMLHRLQGVVSEIDRGINRLARDLRPAALDDLGLVSALGGFVDEWSKTTGIACEFSSRSDEERLSAPVETTVYRIVQEALTNVARHARARHASVAIERRDGRVTLIVEDDGAGFDARAVAAGASAARFGLTGIRERAALLGGTARIDSWAGGTAVFVTLPMTGDERLT